MKGPKPRPIVLSERQRGVLEQIVRRGTSPQREVLRAKIILAIAAGENNEAVARRLGLRRRAVRVWRARWLAIEDRLTGAEAEEDEAALVVMIRDALADAPRSGRPATFTAEQICQIIAVACEEPDTSGRPISHWTPRELADEAIKREIVEEISPRSVGRFLKSGGSETASIALLAQPRPGRRPRGLRPRGKGGV